MFAYWRSALAVLSLGLGLGCRSGCEKPSAPSAPASFAPAPQRLTPPVILARLDRSAYHSRLDLAADAVYLLTMDTAYRLAQGEPLRETKLDLSDIGVATPSAYVYWSQGAFWRAPKDGAPPGPLAAVKDRPALIVSVGERFAWIGPDERGRQAVYNLRVGRPHALHVAEGPVAAATMADDRVVFVERPASDSWRLVSVPTGDGAPSFTATRKGRYPSMLTAAGDVYFYYFDDKDVSEIWAVPPDLGGERVVAKDVICSPLAVAERVFCAHMEGVYEVSPSSGLPTLVYPSMGGSITAIAADAKRIVWVSDVGADKLVVMMLPRDPM